MSEQHDGPGPHRPQAAAAASASGTPRNRLGELLARPAVFTGGFLLALLVVFSILQSDAFLTRENLTNIAVDTAVLLVLATGATFVIITAGIDLSVGAVLVFAGVAAAKIMKAVGPDDVAQGGLGVVVLGLAAALVAGAGWGVLNGLLVARLRIPSLIATLGTLGAATGLARVWTNEQDILEIPSGMSTDIGFGDVLGVPWLVVVALVVAALAAVLLARTRFGRYTYAIGSNVEAANRAGIRTSWHLVKVYALAGTLAGLGGFMSLARFSTTDIGGHSGDNLNAIAAVVLGGASLFGGIGTVVGTVLGAFIPTVLRNGFVIQEIQASWQLVAIGVALILAVYVDQLRRGRQQR